MKKNLSIICLSVILVVLIGLIVWITLPPKASIESYSAVIDVDNAGNITVTETVALDYDDTFNERWRDIKYNKSKEAIALKKENKATLESAEIISIYKDGIDVTNKVDKKYSYNGDVDKHGDAIKCDPYAEECESLYIDATKVGGLGGEVVVTYQYKIIGMVTQYNDVSELNYRLFEYLEGKIKTAYVSVYITPSTNGFKEKDFYAFGHGVSKGSITQNVTGEKKVNEPDFLFAASNIKSDDFFEIRVLFPNKLFTNINEKHIVKTDKLDSILEYELDLVAETNRKYTIANVINIITALAVIATVVVFVIVYKKYDKEYKSPFQGEYYRELPSELLPAHMSYLYHFGETINEDVTATILNLIRKGILIFDENESGVNDEEPNYVLHYCGDDSKFSRLAEHEQIVVNWFICTIGNGKKVSFEEIRNYGDGNYNEAKRFQAEALDFKKAVKDECKHFDFFEKGLSVKKAKVGIYGFILVVLALVCAIVAGMNNMTISYNLVTLFACAFIYLAYVAIIKKRSYNGNEEYSKWKAFKNFLEDFSRFEDYPIPSIIIWEEYLPYATSLKVADKVIEQLEVKLPKDIDGENVDLNRSTYMYTFYRYRRNHFVFMMNRSFERARFNAVSTVAAHNVSKAGGGHGGGFSGGSSFGGGGGGSRAR